MVQDNGDLTPADYLQPAAAPASLTGTISGFGAAAAGLVGGIRSGDIALDVSNVDGWLRKFNDLVDLVDGYRYDLLDAAQEGAAGSGLGNFELSRQIAAKIADRTGGADGGLAWAMDEVVKELRNIHQALSDSKASLVANDAAIADGLNRIALSDSGAPHGG